MTNWNWEHLEKWLPLKLCGHCNGAFAVLLRPILWIVCVSSKRHSLNNFTFPLERALALCAFLRFAQPHTKKLFDVRVILCFFPWWLRLIRCLNCDLCFFWFPVFAHYFGVSWSRNTRIKQRTQLAYATLWLHSTHAPELYNSPFTLRTQKYWWFTFINVWNI